MQNICGLYVEVNWDGVIKRNLTVKSGETIKLERTTVNDEIIAFSELNFKYYAELLEHIENMCEDSYVEVTDGDFGEAGIDIDAYTEILKGELDTKIANSFILACNAILSGIRTDEQEKKIAELERIINENE